MTQHVNIDRLIDEWLEEGPTEVADRVIAAITQDARSTPQPRPSWLPWRSLMNRSFFAVAGALAIVAILAVGYGLYVTRPGVGGGTATPSPFATTDPTISFPPIGPNDNPLAEPGPFDFSDGTGGGAPTTVTIPGLGWYGLTNDRGLFWNDTGGAPPDGAGMLLWVGDLYVYGDPCGWSSTKPAAPATSVDDFVTALTNQASRGASSPEDIAVDGRAGKAVTVRVPDDAVFAQCDRGVFGTLAEGAATSSPSRYHQGPGQIDEFWAIDVDGDLMVFDISYYETTPQNVIDGLHAIVDSATFE